MQIGDPYECAYRVTNSDDNSESITVSSVKDQVHAASGNIDSGELIGSLTWTGSGGATCTPPGPTTTCTLPTNGATIQSDLNSFYTVQAADFLIDPVGHLLDDDVAIVWEEPVCVHGGCPVGPKTSSTGASATILQFTPSVETLLSNPGPVAPGTMITDQASLVGASADAGGTVSYAVYSNNTCSTLVQALGTKTVTNGAVGPSDPWTAVTGNFWFQATYSGDASNVGPVSSVCTTEPITVESPGVSIVKKTNGADANDPNGADVPNIKPGDPVTWTYEVTNTGSTHVPAGRRCRHRQPDRRHTGVRSRADRQRRRIFDPGEVWIYTATGTAIDLTAPPAGVITSPDKCTHGGTETARTAYINTGTATIPGATDDDPSSYCNPPPQNFTDNLTPGFWKTHQAATQALLPQTLGNHVVTQFAEAKTILSGMGCGSVGALNCMAGMLLAAELNLEQGGNTCIQGVVDQANALLIKYNYTGFKPYTISAADKTLAMQLHDLLSAYNIDGVPTC